MNEIPRVVREWVQQKKNWAEAILVRAQHSSPLPPGARLYVNAAGEMCGAISLGCVEKDLRDHLLALQQGGAPRLLHYGAANEFSFEVGLSCGGEIDVLIHPQPEGEVWAALQDLPPERDAILLTNLGAPGMGLQYLYFRDGDSAGTLGQAALDAQAAAAASLLWRQGGHTILNLGATQVFAECVEGPPVLAIVGASPIATALCRLAVVAGFRVVVVDPRSVFARADMFPDAAQVIHQWPDGGLQAAGINERWFVAVLAHDEKLDVPALATALRHQCRYIGLLGSRVTQEKRREELGAAGCTPEDISRVSGPIGLKAIGALEPAEIAVSILAEIIARRRGKL